MAAVKRFRELRAYRVALEQARIIFEVSRTFPKEETYALTDQIRRSSRTVGAMLAEAWGRRRYPAAFASKISEAMGEASETQAWLDHAHGCGYIHQEQHKTLDDAWQCLGGMLYWMLEQSDAFCRKVAKR